VRSAAPPRSLVASSLFIFTTSRETHPRTVCSGAIGTPSFPRRHSAQPGDVTDAAPPRA
jgi:hypothetical protein